MEFEEYKKKMREEKPTWKRTIVDKPKEQPKKKKSKAVLVWGLILIVLILAGVLGYQFWGKQQLVNIYNQGYTQGIIDVTIKAATCEPFGVNYEGQNVTIVAAECYG